MSVRGTLGHQIRSLRSHVGQSGVRGVLDHCAGVYFRQFASVPETNVFERAGEWDLLVVLDACRRDAVAAVADDWPFLGDRGSLWSVASTTSRWLEETVVPDHERAIGETTYVTANPYADTEIDDERFRSVEHVWRDGWDDELGTVPAAAVTDAAIRTHRDDAPARTIVHYMQPHFPSVPGEGRTGAGMDLDSFGESWESIWDDLRAGTADPDAAWQAYLANLEYVLEEVSVLLSNVDAASVVITADHGNLFGEWGEWGHPRFCKMAQLRKVPWCRTSATDEHTVSPPRCGVPRGDAPETTVEERLVALGYGPA